MGRYRGKLITIQGILGGGSRHGWHLSGGTDDKPCTAVEHQGHTWPPQIAVNEYGAGDEIEDGPAKFESDVEQINSMLSEPKRLVSGRDDLVIKVTLVGELRSRKGIKILRSKDGWYVGDGYGQSGQYPAQLVLKTVEDAKVVKKAASDHH